MKTKNVEIEHHQKRSRSFFKFLRFLFAYNTSFFLVISFIIYGCSGEDLGGDLFGSTSKSIGPVSFVPCYMTGTRVFQVVDEEVDLGPEIGSKRLSRSLQIGYQESPVENSETYTQFYVSEAVSDVKFVAKDRAHIPTWPFPRSPFFCITPPGAVKQCFAPDGTVLPYCMPSSSPPCSTFYNTTSSGRIDLHFYSGENLSSTKGLIIDRIDAKCSPDGLTTPVVHPIKLNEQVDGLLVTQGDRIYFRVDRTPEEVIQGGIYLIILKHLTEKRSTHDFNVYVNYSSNLPTQTSYNSALAAYTCASPPCDELKIWTSWPTSDPNDPLTLMVFSSGETGGQFRLFVHRIAPAPFASSYPDGYKMKVYAADFTPSAEERELINQILSLTSQYMLAVSDGLQYIMKWDIYTNQDPSEYSIAFYKFTKNCRREACADLEENILYSDHPATADWLNVNTAEYRDYVGRVLAHEMGHLLYDLPDEYDTQTNYRCCGHSYMATNTLSFDGCAVDYHGTSGNPGTICVDDFPIWWRLEHFYGIKLPGTPRQFPNFFTAPYPNPELYAYDYFEHRGHPFEPFYLYHIWH
jgi:hypothetical protein